MCSSNVWSLSTVEGHVWENKTAFLSGIKKWWLPRRIFSVLRVDENRKHDVLEP